MGRLQRPSINDPAHGFNIQDGTTSFLSAPGALTTIPNAINNAGMVAGAADHDGFIYANGSYRIVADPGSLTTAITGIADDGTAVGVTNFTAQDVGFVLRNTVFTPVDVPGSVSTDPVAINAAEQIAGNCVVTSTPYHAAVNKAFVAVPQ